MSYSEIRIIIMMMMMMMMMINNRAVLDRLVLHPDEGEPNAAECFVHNYQ